MFIISLLLAYGAHRLWCSFEDILVSFFDFGREGVCCYLFFIKIFVGHWKKTTVNTKKRGFLPVRINYETRKTFSLLKFSTVRWNAVVNALSQIESVDLVRIWFIYKEIDIRKINFRKFPEFSANAQKFVSTKLILFFHRLE